jgi:hypothetical protein
MRDIEDRSAIWWLRRDGHKMLVACLCFVSVLMIGAYLGRWSLLAWRLQPAVHTASAKTPADDDLYTGSILFVPPRGDDCRLRYLDNLTGRVWDKGAVSCDGAMAQSAARQPESSPTRIEAIRRGFRRD